MSRYPYELMKLDYEYNALEPVISKETMSFHHGKHLQGYTNNLNAALENNKELQEKTLVEILSDGNFLDKAENAAIRNNGGGVYNHVLYFSTFKKGVEPSEYLKSKLSEAFGSFEEFCAEYKKAGLTQFGSGWAWLVVDANKKLKIVKTPNQDNPLRDGVLPILNIDVWEHSYYLDYQNRRGDHIDEYFKIVNWDVVEERLKAAL